MRCEEGIGLLCNGPQCRRDAKWKRPWFHGPSPTFCVCDEHRHWFISHFDHSIEKWIIGVWKPLERQEELIK